MTRKHFNAIAAIMAESAYVTNSPDAEELRKYLIEQLMYFCSEHNGNFDSDRFRTACNA